GAGAARGASPSPRGRPARPHRRVVSWLDCPCLPSSLWARGPSLEGGGVGLPTLAQREEGRQGQSSLDTTVLYRVRSTWLALKTSGRARRRATTASPAGWSRRST